MCQGGAGDAAAEEAKSEILEKMNKCWVDMNKALKAAGKVHAAAEYNPSPTARFGKLTEECRKYL